MRITNSEKKYGQLLVGVCLILLAVFSVIQTIRFQNEDKQQQRCVEQYLTETIEVLNERTTFTGDVAEADKEQNRALSEIIRLSLREKPPSEQEARKLVEDFGRKLNTYLRLQDQAAKSREDNPYPTRDQYRKCVS